MSPPPYGDNISVSFDIIHLWKLLLWNFQNDAVSNLQHYDYARFKLKTCLWKLLIFGKYFHIRTHFLLKSVTLSTWYKLIQYVLYFKYHHQVPNKIYSSPHGTSTPIGIMQLIRCPQHIFGANKPTVDWLLTRLYYTLS